MKCHYKLMEKPIKINYTCSNCGRKRTITYTYINEFGGALSNHNEQCMPYMECPRCHRLSMKEDRNE